MKKIIKFITNNLLGFIIGVLFFTGTVYAATVLSAGEVSYSNPKSNASTVQEAIDELYTRVGGEYYFFGNTYNDGTKATGYKSYLTTDYNEIINELGSRAFVKVQSNGIKQACFYRNDHLFCINTNEYETSKELIREEFGGESASCGSSNSYFGCYDGSSYCNAISDGRVICFDGTVRKFCGVSAAGEVSCGI